MVISHRILAVLVEDIAIAQLAVLLFPSHTRHGQVHVVGALSLDHLAVTAVTVGLITIPIPDQFVIEGGSILPLDQQRNSGLDQLQRIARAQGQGVHIVTGVELQGRRVLRVRIVEKVLLFLLEAQELLFAGYLLEILVQIRRARLLLIVLSLDLRLAPDSQLFLLLFGGQQQLELLRPR